MSKTEIKIEFEYPEDKAMCASGPITRTVFVDQKMVYMDRMTADLYRDDDPIRGLELFLLGMKKGQSRHNGRTDAGYFVRLIQRIKRKLFR